VPDVSNFIEATWRSTNLKTPIHCVEFAWKANVITENTMSQHGQPFWIYRFCSEPEPDCKLSNNHQINFTYPVKSKDPNNCYWTSSQNTLVGCDGVWTLFVGMMIHAVKFISWFQNHNSKQAILDNVEVLYLICIFKGRILNVIVFLLFQTGLTVGTVCCQSPRVDSWFGAVAFVQ
jgi:hypothetical protein